MQKAASSSKPMVRFGIMCNGTTFTWWQAVCLKKLLSVENVKPALLIIDDTAGNISYPNDIDMAQTFDNTPAIRCRAIKKGKYSEYFSESDIETIRSYNLDFVLRFAFNIIRGEILRVPRYGIWSFHHDDEEKYRGAPACYWEIYNGDKVTGAILQRLTDRLDGGIVLRKGFFKTIDTSHILNRDNVVLESTDWPAQVCIDIQNGITGYLDAPPSKTEAPIYYYPTRLQRWLMRLKILRNEARNIYRSAFFYERWNIGIAKAPIHSFLAEGKAPEVQWMPTPHKGKFIADPFAVVRDNKLHIFFEEYDYVMRKGYISAMGMDSGNLTVLNGVFSPQFHLSYPYIVEYEGDIYCVPESSEAKEIALYKIKEFPNKWEKAAVFVKDFAGLDGTIFQYEGRWWLFAVDRDDGPWHRLRAWYADDFFSPWMSHANNPIKMDIRSARPAGTPFVHDGQLYRPAQDCSRTYGGRVVINRVLKLTPYEFKEEEVSVVKPYKKSPYPDGLHTLAQAGSMTIIDGKKEAFFGIGKGLFRLAVKAKARLFAE